VLKHVTNYTTKKQTGKEQIITMSRQGYLCLISFFLLYAILAISDLDDLN